jgi:hypothetical protein
MAKPKGPAQKLVAVRIPPALNKAVEKLARRDGVMKKDVFITALTNHVEAANVNA